jgi:hypothetical protein
LKTVLRSRETGDSCPISINPAKLFILVKEQLGDFGGQETPTESQKPSKADQEPKPSPGLPGDRIINLE